MLDLNFLCDEVQKIARSAGLFLKNERERFNNTLVEEKSSHNYVTYVDKESERLIVESLSALLPEAGFLTEEGTVNYQNEKYYWIIDPLDGTTNYIHDNAPYCVSIALRDENSILLGVVYEVCRDECFHACRGGNAFLNGREIHVSGESSLKRAFIALGFPYSFDDYRSLAIHLVNSLYGKSGGCRVQGSAAVELCYVACGRFDGRIEAYLGAWDVAAGGLILMQAGGAVSDFNGGHNWTTGREVIASNGRLHEALLALVKTDDKE